MGGFDHVGTVVDGGEGDVERGIACGEVGDDAWFVEKRNWQRKLDLNC